MGEIKKAWWKESIVYQIYPRSFKDSNSDGVGDLRGIISKLDYIKKLGVDIIWLCPVYESPNDDNGYDISDYRSISHEFGNMADFNVLLQQVHDKGMKLIMDLVANHTSDEHEWFKESGKSKDNPYRDYYYWRKGKENGEPPTNWPSFFGGSVWQYDEATEEYYLHLFSKKQPDLNWENPKVRQEIYDVIRYWFDKGVDGFRMDVISLISKDMNFPDADTEDFGEIITKYYANGPRIHEFLQEMNHEVLSKYDIMTVGEGPGIDFENGPKYVGEDRNELNMIFHFGHMYIDNGPGGKYDPVKYNLVDFKKVFKEWDDALRQGWGSIFLGNHDFPRIVSRFGNDKDYWQESAKMLATLLMTMRGTPYIFQGDEIGMTNVAFQSIHEYNDIETVNAWQKAEAEGKDLDEFLKLVHIQSRDNARTPVQWDNSSYAGFSDKQPWLQVNPAYDKINVAAQEKDEKSILNYYRKIIQFRKANPTLVYGSYDDLLPKDENLFYYRRFDNAAQFIIILNFSDHEQKFKKWIPGEWQMVFNNYDGANSFEMLRPWEAKVFQIL